MSRIGQYLLSVIATALVVSVSNVLIDKKGAIGSTLKLITGLVLAMVIISPWADFRIDDLQQLYLNAESDSTYYVQQGQAIVQSEISAYIMIQTEAYILDKASILGLDISADVALKEDAPYEIDSIRIIGSASPYAKKRMTQLICDDLDISEECLIWT